jgi:hypothetical protein
MEKKELGGSRIAIAGQSLYIAQGEGNRKDVVDFGTKCRARRRYCSKVLLRCSKFASIVLSGEEKYGLVDIPHTTLYKADRVQRIG